MPASNPTAGERKRALKAQAARGCAANAVCRAGATDPFSPACYAAVNWLRYKLQPIERLAPKELMRDAQRAA